MPASRRAADADAAIVTSQRGAMQDPPYDLMRDALVAQVSIMVGVTRAMGSALGTILPRLPGFSWQCSGGLCRHAARCLG